MKDEKFTTKKGEMTDKGYISINELNKLFKNGFITEDTYNNILSNIEKEKIFKN